MLDEMRKRLPICYMLGRLYTGETRRLINTPLELLSLCLKITPLPIQSTLCNFYDRRHNAECNLA